METIINYMKSPLSEESTPALRCAGQILASSNVENTDLFLFHGGLAALNNMLQNDQE